MYLWLNPGGKSTMATRRRGNGEGTIRQKPDGRWEARYVAADGARKSVMGKTRAEVAAKLAAAIRDRDKGLSSVIGSRQTVAQYLSPGWRRCAHRAFGKVPATQ